MSTTFWIYGVCGLIALIGSIAIVRSVVVPKSASKIRGMKPGKGDTLIDHGISMGISGGGHPTTSRVTRDPQQYAKAMAPKK